MPKQTFGRWLAAKTCIAVLALLSLAHTAIAQTKYAIVVGVNSSDVAGQELQWAEADACRMWVALTETLQVPPENCMLRLSPRREDLVGDIHRLTARIRPADTVIFYYSGHGGIFPGQGSLLATRETILGSPEGSPTVALSGDELTKLLGAIPATNLLVVLDACRDAKAAVLNAPDAWTGLGAALATFTKKDGQSGARTAVVWVGCKSGQKSIESPACRGGLFTHCVLEAIEQVAKAPALASGEQPGMGVVDTNAIWLAVQRCMTAWPQKHPGEVQVPVNNTAEAGNVVLLRGKTSATPPPLPVTPPNNDHGNEVATKAECAKYKLRFYSRAGSKGAERDRDILLTKFESAGFKASLVDVKGMDEKKQASIYIGDKSLANWIRERKSTFVVLSPTVPSNVQKALKVALDDFKTGASQDFIFQDRPDSSRQGAGEALAVEIDVLWFR